MTEDTVINITMATVWLIVKVSAPMLLVSLVVGLLISIFQTVTSIQEQTLTFVPKLLAIMLALMIMGPWLLNEIVSYMNILWGSFAQYIS